jgi:hypothetical protein
MADTLEARIKNLEKELGSLKKDLRDKEKQIETLKDIEDIKNLQGAYGYYLENWMGPEIIDLFSKSPEVSATFIEGTYLGWEGVRRYFSKSGEPAPEFLHQVLQVNPVITVDPDGLRAKGRWYGYGTVGFSPLNGNINPTMMDVIYEMEYIKEKGIWKILKLAFQVQFFYNIRQLCGLTGAAPAGSGGSLKVDPDIFAEYDTTYPSGHIYPMHFVHPVTGKVTSEAKRNAKLKLKPNSFKPKK